VNDKRDDYFDSLRKKGFPDCKTCPEHYVTILSIWVEEQSSRRLRGLLSDQYVEVIITYSMVFPTMPEHSESIVADGFLDENTNSGIYGFVHKGLINLDYHPMITKFSIGMPLIDGPLYLMTSTTTTANTTTETTSTSTTTSTRTSSTADFSTISTTTSTTSTTTQKRFLAAKDVEGTDLEIFGTDAKWIIACACLIVLVVLLCIVLYCIHRRRISDGEIETITLLERFQWLTGRVLRSTSKLQGIRSSSGIMKPERTRSSLETLKRPNVVVDPYLDEAAFRAAVRAEIARWPADSRRGAMSSVEAMLQLMVEAESGAMVAIAPWACLKGLHLQSTDGGYLSDKLKGVSVFKPEFRRVFLDFVKHSDDDCWPKDYPDQRARGLPKDGAILLENTGMPAKCATKLVGLPQGPCQWPGHGTRHESALALASHMTHGVILIHSSSGNFHCLLARDRGCLALKPMWFDGNVISPKAPRNATVKSQVLAKLSLGGLSFTSEGTPSTSAKKRPCSPSSASTAEGPPSKDCCSQSLASAVEEEAMHGDEPLGDAKSVEDVPRLDDRLTASSSTSSRRTKVCFSPCSPPLASTAEGVVTFGDEPPEDAKAMEDAPGFDLVFPSPPSQSSRSTEFFL